MKKNLTEMVFILDRSGSMHGMEADTIGGFNSMLDKQRETEGDAIISTVLFNQESKVICDRAPIASVAPMTEQVYTVGGCTALIDALGGAVHFIDTIHRHIRPEDVPEHTVFVIITDGMENASRKYTANDVRAMVKEKQEKNGWEFLFLGANIDSVSTAANYGIRAEHAVDYTCDAEGTRTNFRAVSSAISGMRRDSRPISDDWSAEVREYHESSRMRRK